MNSIGWGVWLLRLALSIAVVGVVAFAVSDYVVKANFGGLATSIELLNGSIDRLDQSIRDNTAAMRSMEEKFSEHMNESAASTTEIAYLRSDVEKIKAAVEGSGINIPAGWRIDAQSWSDIQQKYGISDDTPVFLSATPEGNGNGFEITPYRSPEQ